MSRKLFRTRTLGAAGVLVLCGWVLSGCQLLGPSAISGGRDRYNAIIQTTSMEQTMSNIVRVYNHEPTMFMDVTEVDAVSSFAGSLSGGATSIGAEMGTRVSNSSAATYTGRLGNAAGTVQYSETPTIRYQPLLGQALVAQMVTPVSVDALGLLYDLYWSVAPLLDFAMAYLTLDYDEFYTSLNTIIELDNRGAIELAAAKSALPKPPEASAAKSPSSTGTGKDKAASKKGDDDNDSLVVFLRPFHAHPIGDAVGPDETKRVQAARGRRLLQKKRVLQLWVRLLRVYIDYQPVFEQVNSAKCRQIGLTLEASKKAAELKDWDLNIDQKVSKDGAQADKQLDEARDCLPNSIEFRVVPAPNFPASAGAKSTTASRRADRAAGTDIATHAPLVRTYSALGILKNATERPHPKIEFVTPEDYQAIRNDAWNQDVDSITYYTLLPTQEDTVDCKPEQRPDGCDNPATGDADEKTAYKNITAEIGQWIKAEDAGTAPPGGEQVGQVDERYQSDLDVYETKGKDALEDSYVQRNRRLGLLRRYILIVVSDHLPPEPVYVSYSDGDRWYYIVKGDTISAKNFHLLTLFLTMMAVPPSTQPLSPVINVGG